LTDNGRETVLDLFAVSVVMIRLLAIQIIVTSTAAIPAAIAFIRQASSTGEFSLAFLPAVTDQNGGTLIRSRVRVENIIEEFVKTGLGVWLLFGRKRILVSIRSMWEKGISAESPE